MSDLGASEDSTQDAAATLLCPPQVDCTAVECDLTSVLSYYPTITGIHPACLAVPSINDADRTLLEADIAKNGLHEEILLTSDGMLLDGRNRLIACFKGHIEPRFRKVQSEPWGLAYSQNIARRHLDTVDKCKFAEAWAADEKAKAKERESKGRPKEGVETFPQDNARSRDAIGERVGVSGKTYEQYEQAKRFAPPEVVRSMEAKEISINQAYREAQKVKKQQSERPGEAPQPPPVVEGETVEIVTARGEKSRIAKPKKVVFNATTDAVDWASWTWNPVTGCNHGCNFCYAREIAHSEKMRPYYPNQFEPTFHEYRLSAPSNTSKPASDDPRSGRVFVCSMADLFGKWVPDEWIEKVFEACQNEPKWQYLFLTKWPARYSQMPLIPRAWYGASVIQQSDVARVEADMAKIPPGQSIVRWISLEPMLGEIEFSDLSWCDLVVIGGQTATNQPSGPVSEFAPDFDWVFNVYKQCRDAGVPCYLKANLGLDKPGMKLPKPSPRYRD